MPLGEAESNHGERGSDLHVSEDAHACLFLGGGVHGQRVDDKLAI